MPSVLIISPNPEANRMLKLAFELAGFSTKTAADAAKLSRENISSDMTILDVIENSAEHWKIAREAARAIGKIKMGMTILLPRGHEGKNLPLECKKSRLIIRKPYELMDMVERVKDAIATSIPKKSSSSRKNSRRRS